jgi:hypothetical protein
MERRIQWSVALKSKLIRSGLCDVTNPLDAFVV